MSSYRLKDGQETQVVGLSFERFGWESELSMENSILVDKLFALVETGFLDHKGQEIHGLVIVIIIMLLLLLLPLPLMLMLILDFFSFNLCFSSLFFFLFGFLESMISGNSPCSWWNNFSIRNGLNFDDVLTFVG